MNEVTVRFGGSPTVSKIGSELTLSQRSAPSGRCTPRTKFRTGSPVARQTMEGWASAGIGAPEASIIRQSSSTELLPSNWSWVRPNSAAAAGLWRRMVLVRSCSTTPSRMAAKIVRN